MSSKRVNGKYVITGLVAFTGLFGLAFWWSQNHAYYEETQADAVEIAGTVYPVTEWKGIDAASSPLKMRACFLIRESIEAPPALAPEPLVAPGWFRCFNAEFIADELARDYVAAYVAQFNDPYGFDRIVAVFPGGRAYMWRQPNGLLGE
ncbi:MAG: DUF6446 family protein [Thermohalobaculum sp.]